jgi:hypothetical protein
MLRSTTGALETGLAAGCCVYGNVEQAAIPSANARILKPCCKIVFIAFPSVARRSRTVVPPNHNEIGHVNATLTFSPFMPPRGMDGLATRWRMASEPIEPRRIAALLHQSLEEIAHACRISPIVG